MNIKKTILNILQRKEEVRVSDIVNITGYSRIYINRFFRELRDEGKITLIGKANSSRYILSTAGTIKTAINNIKHVHRFFKNDNLKEDVVLNELKKKNSIFNRVPKNIFNIVEYAFSEMLNNAIEHSNSNIIEVSMKREDNSIKFEVIDKGIGIFNNIKKKKNLKDNNEAMQDLLKGKQTTAPKFHTGEGIFFTSKVATIFTIQSSLKKIVFDNLIEDVFIRSSKNTKGTKIVFVVNFDSKSSLQSVFSQYTDDSFKFSKTQVKIKLYKGSEKYFSRSQARRILIGLEKFKTIILDFKQVDTVGQAFADEVFRVWHKNHKTIKIATKNTNNNVDFMIKHALAQN